MTTQSQPVLNPIAAGACDIAEGLRNWRIWHLMGTSELRRRYARSRLGQFWLTLSTAITVVTLGAVWSLPKIAWAVLVCVLEGRRTIPEDVRRQNTTSSSCTGKAVVTSDVSA